MATKQMKSVLLTPYQVAFVQSRALKRALNFSEYIRLLIDLDIQNQEAKNDIQTSLGASTRELISSVVEELSTVCEPVRLSGDDQTAEQTVLGSEPRANGTDAGPDPVQRPQAKTPRNAKRHSKPKPTGDDVL